MILDGFMNYHPEPGFAKLQDVKFKEHGSVWDYYG